MPALEIANPPLYIVHIPGPLDSETGIQRCVRCGAKIFDRKEWGAGNIGWKSPVYSRRGGRTVTPQPNSRPCGRGNA